jgi:hypothetical protein
MPRRPRAAFVLLLAMMVATSVPAATQAAASPDMSVATVTPLGRNLLQNPGFDAVPTAGSVPGWEAEGGVRVERFGTRPWPYPAYGRKYGGGSRYLGCAGSPGLVRQTVVFDGGNQTRRLKAHLVVDFGGLTGHSILITLRATGPGIDHVDRTLKPLVVTNSYRRAVAHVAVWPGTDQLTATIELVGAAKGSRCRMVADTAKLEVFVPGHRPPP